MVWSRFRFSWRLLIDTQMQAVLFPPLAAYTVPAFSCPTNAPPDPTLSLSTRQVRDSLLSIALSHGVQIRTSTRVRRISPDPTSGRLSHVELAGGETLVADAVVTNVDVAESMGLVKPSSSAVKPGQGRQGESAVTAGAGAAEAVGAAADGRYAHAQQRRERLEAAEYRYVVPAVQRLGGLKQGKRGVS